MVYVRPVVPTQLYRMADARLPIPRLPSQLLLLLLLAAAPCILGQGRCGGFNCKNNCSLEPQRCDECCSKGSGGAGPAGAGEKMTELERELAEVKEEVGEVKLMLTVLMVLVAVLVVGAGAGLVLYFRLRCHASSLPLFLRGKAVRDKAKEAKKVDSTKATPDPTAVRIAQYQNKHSPLGRRASSMRRATTTTNPPDDPQVPHFSKQRARQPSESSSPDDPTTPTTSTTTSTTPDHPHAYHNLALSTSTLHDTTTSSTSTLGPGISTITLDTTLASGTMHTSPPHSRI